ncbi:TadE/TadG family type IV pilus assembly protein [Tropicimonas isoalkanivorans]|uniref:TadE-like protein n=1 Tax=Tropicimonas isoalkanivorans TaxID=441112 RepID=A0A1I1DXV7_9RHOB|nr:TadE/TadG family type IV pilus assembly protein [Tropicimonas isoalkanivorans]SFB79256.1 TadE-like protein [Tropicimonas isoalkanivorans]
MPRIFQKDEDGSVTIEFVLWVPFFAIFLLFAVDATLVFMRQSQMWQISRETARIVSRYGMDEVTAETFAKAYGTVGSTTPTVDVILGTAEVSVDMQLPLAALAPFGILKFAVGDKVAVHVTHAMEPIFVEPS